MLTALLVLTPSFNDMSISFDMLLQLYHGIGDYDWNRNPYGDTLVTNMPQGMIDEILAIRTVGGHNVFRWGGYYSGSKDAMVNPNTTHSLLELD
jgi:hypothetical protein